MRLSGPNIESVSLCGHTPTAGQATAKPAPQTSASPGVKSCEPINPRAVQPRPAARSIVAMQSPLEDGFSPLNYSDFVNDVESVHMFNTDSPTAGSMSVDPSSIFLTNDNAASPMLNSLAPNHPSTSKTTPTQFLTTDSFTNSPRQPRSTLSSASPESSSHDSSSDSSGRRKRKSPDSSSPSAAFNSYTSHTWARNANMDTETQSSRTIADSPLTGEGPGPMQDLDPNMQFINSELQNNFDFNSAASSPKGFAVTPVAASAMGMKQMPRSTIGRAIPPVSNSFLPLVNIGHKLTLPRFRPQPTQCFPSAVAIIPLLRRHLPLPIRLRRPLPMPTIR